MMDGSSTVEADDNLSLLPPSPHLSVAIAVNGNRNSKFMVRWALEKFIPEGTVFVKLIHVRERITAVPTASKYSSCLCLGKQVFLILSISL